MQAMYRQCNFYSYYYFTPRAGRLLHDGWRSV